VTGTEWLDEREERAWRNLQFMQMRLEHQLSRQLGTDSSLSLSDYVVLVALTAQPDGRLRSFELARMLGWEKTRLSHHLKRMVARDLVDKQPCPTDGRGFFAVATAEGRQAIELAAPGHVATVRRLFVDLVSPAELEVIGDVATRVLDALDVLDDAAAEERAGGL
jgi:DNA-binding MarR family transcriptional regulator